MTRSSKREEAVRLSGKGFSYAEIGCQLEITGERVRQIVKPKPKPKPQREPED